MLAPGNRSFVESLMIAGGPFICAVHLHHELHASFMGLTQMFPSHPLPSELSHSCVAPYTLET